MIKEIEIPEGYEARIEGNKVIIEHEESEDEKIRKELYEFIKVNSPTEDANRFIAWLENQKEHKPVEENEKETEINLVKILKHYPKETELYSPLYGKLWLAKVDERNGVITCYRYPLDEGCTRAILEQEDTVSFYSNGTTGLPDFSVSEDCMLFLYDTKRQSEQKPVECSEEDEYCRNQLIVFCENCMQQDSAAIRCANWLKSLPERFNLQPKQEWSEEDKEKIDDIIRIICDARECSKIAKIGEEKEDNSAFYNELVLFLKSLCSHWKPNEEQISALEYFIRSWGESGTMSPQNPVLCAAKSLLTDLQKLL